MMKLEMLEMLKKLKKALKRPKGKGQKPFLFEIAASRCLKNRVLDSRGNFEYT
jgi:competence protein ComGF